MILVGKNITAKDDPLQKIKPDYLYHKLINPDPEINAKIRQLRVVRLLDYKQYSFLKRQLPYIVCGIFNPPFRRTENFGFTEYFIIDIDHIGEKELSVETLRKQIEADKGVFMSFVSPGEDGLKIMFRLKEKCYDAGIYSIFYRLFTQQFATKFNLQQVVDIKTSDVARACFVSVDPHAYYNPLAEPIDLESYMNVEDTSELFRIKKQLDAQNTDTSEKKEKPVAGGADDDAIQKIKALLNPSLKSLSEKREVFIPEEIEKLLDGLVPYLLDAGVVVKEIVGINYGKKIRTQLGLKESEINLFYGRKGFSVVQTPRRGTDDELNALVAKLIEQYIMQ